MPSAEMSSFKYALRSKYIISLKIFVSRHVFLQQKYTFYTTSLSFIGNYTEYFKVFKQRKSGKTTVNC